MKNDKNRDYMVVRSSNKKILGRAKKINISNVDKSGRFTNKKIYIMRIKVLYIGLNKIFFCYFIFLIKYCFIYNMHYILYSMLFYHKHIIFIFKKL